MTQYIRQTRTSTGDALQQLKALVSRGEGDRKEHSQNVTATENDGRTLFRIGSNQYTARTPMYNALIGTCKLHGWCQDLGLRIHMSEEGIAWLTDMGEHYGLLWDTARIKETLISLIEARATAIELLPGTEFNVKYTFKDNKGLAEDGANSIFSEIDEYKFVEALFHNSKLSAALSITDTIPIFISQPLTQTIDEAAAYRYQYSLRELGLGNYKRTILEDFILLWQGNWPEVNIVENTSYYKTAVPNCPNIQLTADCLAETFTLFPKHIQNNNGTIFLKNVAVIPANTRLKTPILMGITANQDYSALVAYSREIDSTLETETILPRNGTLFNHLLRNPHLVLFSRTDFQALWGDFKAKT